MKLKKIALVLVGLLLAGSVFADTASFQKVWNDVVKTQKLTITKSTPLQTYAELVSADVKAKIKAPDSEKKYGKTAGAILQNVLKGKAKEADVVAALTANKNKDVPAALGANKAGITLVAKDNKLDQKAIDGLSNALKAKKINVTYDAKTDVFTATE